MTLIERACETLTTIRDSSPLVHNMTNVVVANTTANALLALGASPAMVDAPLEAPQLASVAGALVINLGTITPAQAEAMKLACEAAQQADVPWILDPVAVGPLTYRSNLARELLAFKPAVIRGNASEIMALAGLGTGGKGVDSTDSSETALDSAKSLANETGAAVAVSGPTDYITDGTRTVTVKNGHDMMPAVTGLGCTATALIGAALAATKDPVEAAAFGLLYLGVAGEVAAEGAAGPASLQTDIINQLYHLNTKLIRERGNMGEL